MGRHFFERETYLEVHGAYRSIDRSDNYLKRLLRNWTTPGAKNRRIPEQLELEKWAPSVYTVNLEEYSLRLFSWLRMRNEEGKVRLYTFEEVTPKQLEEML